MVRKTHATVTRPKKRSRKVAVRGERRDELFAKWNGWIRVLAVRIAKTINGEAEECYQELMCELAKRFPDYDSRKGSFSTFAGWIARGVQKVLLHRKDHQSRLVDGTLSPRENDEVRLIDLEPDTRPGSDPVEEAGRRELIELVRREVDGLPRRLRSVVRRFFEFDGAREGHHCTEAFDEALRVLRERVRVSQMV